mmetsp:Transcript_10411/g.30173  ORF Transcript_10411/g.30173 Transcript_10411/m.30173 type:complete len:107 (-) Transcript_10411:1117-1437(-)
MCTHTTTYIQHIRGGHTALQYVNDGTYTYVRACATFVVHLLDHILQLLDSSLFLRCIKICPALADIQGVRHKLTIVGKLNVEPLACEQFTKFRITPPMLKPVTHAH